MEQLTKKERVGLIAFSIIVAVGIFIAMLTRNLRVHDIGDNGKNQKEIAEFERQVMKMESDTTESKTVKRKKKDKQKTVYKDINPLEDKMERK